MTSHRARVLLCATCIAASIGYGLVRMPLQVSDSLDELIVIHRTHSVWAAFTSTIGESAYFRPLRFAQDRILLDLAPGHEFAAFKALHILLMAAAVALFLAALPIRDAVDASAALFALIVFTGLHTFVAVIMEAYPINHFLEILVLSLAAFHLGRARPRLLIDLAAIAALLAGCLTLESGVLIWVVLVSGRWLGRRGVSDRALAASTVVLAAYLFVRFIFLAPNLQAMGNASGYFFERLERSQIPARFGRGFTRFNLYNIVASAATVLFSEPRAGVTVFGKALADGRVPPRIWINVLSSAITTVVIAATIWRRRTARDDGPDGRDARDAWVTFAAVLVASSIASYAYAKDDIMSTAGAFYAIAVFWSIRDLLGRPPRLLASAVLAVALLVAAAGWSLRTIGTNHVLRSEAFIIRNDWAWVPEAMQQRGTWPADVDSQAFVLRLRNEALRMPIVNPWFMERWADQVFQGDFQ